MGALAEGVSELAGRLRERRRARKDATRDGLGRCRGCRCTAGLDETRRCIESVLRYPRPRPIGCWS